MNIIIVRNRHGKILFMGDRLTVCDTLHNKIDNLKGVSISLMDHSIEWIKMKKDQIRFYNDCIHSILDNTIKSSGDCCKFRFDLGFGSIQCKDSGVNNKGSDND